MTVRILTFARRAIAAAACAVAVAVALMPVSAAAQPGDGRQHLEDVHTTSRAGSYLAARVAGSLRDTPAAARFYRTALASDPGNEALLDRGFLLSLVAGDIEEAVPLAERLTWMDPGHRLARLTLAVDSLAMEDFPSAGAHLEGLGEEALIELTAALLRAWAAQGRGEHGEALEIVAGLTGQDWYGMFTPYQAGLMAEVAGDRESAARFHALAYENDSGSPRVVQAHARALALDGRSDEAARVLAAFEEVMAGHPMIRAAAETVAAGEAPAAIATTAQEGAAEALLGIGSILGADGGEDFAAIYLQFALFLSPGNDMARLALAAYFEQAGDRRGAVRAYEAVGEDSPMRRTADIYRAGNLDEIDRFDEARELIERLISDDPEDTRPVVALANLLRGREMFAEAAEVYSDVIDRIDQVSAEHWIHYFGRGISYERSRQWELAEPDLIKALELNPEQPYVLNYLGYSWVDQGVNLEEALDMIKRAVELRSDDGAIVDSLGWAYYRLGRYDDAVTQLERAVELLPQDPVINDHLGDAYWRVGRRVEARFQWSHARDLDPDPDDLELILDKIENGLPEDRERTAAELRHDG